MTAASSQVQVKASKGRAQINSSDVFDPSEGDDDAENRVLDMMKTGLSAPQLLRHLEVVSSREFAYEDIEQDGRVMHGRSLEMEAFMEHPIEIIIAETTDAKASPLCYVSVNGDERWIPRGIRVRVPRKHVERLAQSSERTFTTPQTSGQVADNDNERPAKAKSTQAYSFQVMKDPCKDVKLARRWLQRVTKQST